VATEGVLRDWQQKNSLKSGVGKRGGGQGLKNKN